MKPKDVTSWLGDQIIWGTAREINSRRFANYDENCEKCSVNLGNYTIYTWYTRYRPSLGQNAPQSAKLQIE
jgi:hypothetical protein